MTKLESIFIKIGVTEKNENRMCIMEAVAFVAGESWSDHPKCVSRVIAAPKGGLVHCTVCHRDEKVNAAACFSSGWPLCHGYTMTIDSHADRCTATRGGR